MLFYKTKIQNRFPRSMIMFIRYPYKDRFTLFFRIYIYIYSNFHISLSGKHSHYPSTSASFFLSLPPSTSIQITIFLTYSFSLLTTCMPVPIQPSFLHFPGHFSHFSCPSNPFISCSGWSVLHDLPTTLVHQPAILS